MSTTANFNVRFWGVRGTIATASPAFMRYGGNTSCVEVTCGTHTFILDAGTGIHALGKSLATKDITILFSHTHLDHICGLPFFAPAYDPEARIELWAGHLRPQYDLMQVVRHIMAAPVFPVTPEQFAAQIRYHDFTAGLDLRTSKWLDAGITIRTMPLPHPDRATGYRIEYAGQSLCYITDIEHIPGRPNEDLVNFVRDTSCLVYDATYCDEEFERYTGWGHSTWQEAVRIGKLANVGKVIAFHHDPDADDEKLDTRRAQLEKASPNARMAYERMEIQLA